ncbi:N-acetyl-gamma-glutamyl-phosphate reductase [Paraferrimonas sp. SM1919]|uniref:N-acetyl-gamma-glutamyl-phosphate reductase n=1 Tax=Paraferrimonas sp. SM1919 TaxID=2662263 RepID=UPI0013CF7DAE|nr:N-acetyl-gamma-glutamyl-phosphate reductase [Paraferrimonas sp. SM1919]
MKKIAIVGATGYAGAQLAQLIQNSPLEITLAGLYVSENSADKGKSLNSLYPSFAELDYQVQPLTQDAKAQICQQADAVALATAHEVSLTLVHEFIEAGLSVFDLSAAYRMQDLDVYPKWYGFEHQHPQLLKESVYGLVEWAKQDITKAKMIAVPGCYPTASLLALKPIKSLLDENQWPVINAVSGVSGAGRKASLNSSFCEVSLTPYGVLSHRHQPEIKEHLGADVIFTPHLGNFKRGILATITVKLKAGTSAADVAQAFNCYDGEANVIVKQGVFPKVDDVVHSSRCHIGWQLDEASGHLVIGSAIDNLMKGAASQAFNCITIHYGLEKGSAA